MTDLKKNFVFFVGAITHGGAERVISILTHHMAKQGYHVEILLLHEQEIFYDIDDRVKITVVETESGTENIIKNILWIRRFFKKHADTIISFLAPFNIVALIAHFGLKSKIIVADRNDPRFIPNKFPVRKLRDFLYVFANGVVLQTTQNKKYFSRSIQKKSVIIPNPIDLGEKVGQALREKKRKEIVSVGRLMPQKNQALLLDAFANIKDDFPEYTLTIYGEGPERERLEKETIKRGIQNRVRLPGNVKDIFDKISSSEIFVLSSNYEGMPNALIEAMCLGLPCITTNVSGAEDLIESGVNGEIVPVGDRTALEEAIKGLLSNPEKRKKYEKAALRTNERLRIDKVMDQWGTYLTSL